MPGGLVRPDRPGWSLAALFLIGEGHLVIALTSSPVVIAVLQGNAEDDERGTVAMTFRALATGPSRLAR